jgi:hypothetical protein
MQSKITDVVKDSTDDLWFLDTDDSDDDIFGIQSDSDVYANEYELISERGDTGDRSDDDEITVHSSQQVKITFLTGLMWGCISLVHLAY